MKERVLIALTGHAGSGKTTEANRMRELYGFTVASGSDIIRREAESQGVELTQREDYIALNKQLRCEKGSKFLIESMLAVHTNLHVIEGLRNYTDYTEFTKQNGIVIALLCSDEVAYKRILKDKNRENPESFQAFVAERALDYNDPSRYGAHTLRVMDEADYRVRSDWPTQHFHAHMDELVRDIVRDARRLAAIPRN